jgi:predicted PurR-regulated permease PerM
MNWREALPAFRTGVIWVGLASGAFLLWQLRIVLLVAFAAVLTAILLRVIMRLICRPTGLPEGAGLTVAVVLLILIFGGTAFLFGSQLTNQFQVVIQRVQTAETSVSGFLQQNGLGQFGVAQQSASFLRQAIPNILSAGLSVTEGLVVLAISAIYLAADPDLYRRGASKLVKRNQREEFIHGLDLIGTSLRLWLVGELILMLTVGVLTYIAVLLLGLPSPIALALIAGITELIPYLGPFIGAVPAVLVALTTSLDLALWTGAAYLGIHLIEGYVMGPLVQRHFVTIPPALVLIGILAAEAIFGMFGIVVAAPLTAAIFVAVKVFYIRDILNERTTIPTKSPI